MSFNFRLLVSGLCAFVPLDDQSMRIVPVNARDFDHGGNPVTPMTPIGDIHIPLLAVPAQFGTGKGRRPKFRFANKKLLPATTFLAFPLDDDDLEVTRATASPVALPGSVDPCPTQATQGEFGWIARMSDVSAGTMDPTARTGTPNIDLVLARLRFAYGECRTSAFAGDFFSVGNTVIKWTYTDNGGTELANYVHRAVAELMTVRIEIDDSVSREVIITSSKNDSIVLAPTMTEEPRAFLLNVPLPDLLNENDPTVSTSRNHHFLHFYRLSTNHAPTFAPLPLPREICDGLTSGLGGPKCPPTFFGG